MIDEGQQWLASIVFLSLDSQVSSALAARIAHNVDYVKLSTRSWPRRRTCVSSIPPLSIFPVSTDAYGAIHVRGTRLYDHFCFSGRRDPEDIVQKFPSVALPDVYLVIAHY